MSTNLTEREFSTHVGTQFTVALTQGELSLTLAEVKAYTPLEGEQPGMERFSAFFDGPPDLLLQQRTYQLRHEQMGEFDIFLTPIAGDSKRFRYEAVFNYYRT
ncbi:MAG TPA: hypothetical protein VFX97_13790 [Pyrinomonadaceae bacterium]|nr:hypothetical protein [Pyrinomonadaceae bacterium]